jgi:hypothetical protein
MAIGAEHFNRQETGPIKEAEINIKQKAIQSGIADRMLAKQIAEKHIPTNRPLKEGISVANCDFTLEISVDRRAREKSRYVSIAIAFPSSATTEMTFNSWGVGKVEGDELIFAPSFGANGDAPLTDDQKEVVRQQVSNALRMEVKKSDKVSY